MNHILFQAAINCGDAYYFSGHYYVKDTWGKWWRWYETYQPSWIDEVPFLGY